MFFCQTFFQNKGVYATFWCAMRIKFLNKPSINQAAKSRPTGCIKFFPHLLLSSQRVISIMQSTFIPNFIFSQQTINHNINKEKKKWNDQTGVAGLFSVIVVVVVVVVIYPFSNMHHFQLPSRVLLFFNYCSSRIPQPRWSACKTLLVFITDDFGFSRSWKKNF